MYYLKATFGPRTGDAVLEILVFVTSNNTYLKVDYQISSPKIELDIWQSKADNRKKETVRRFGDQYGGGGWSNVKFPLDSDVRSIQLVARKIGVTTDVEYVFVGVVEVIENPGTGNMLLLYYTTVFVVCCFKNILQAQCCCKTRHRSLAFYYSVNSLPHSYIPSNIVSTGWAKNRTIF